MAQKRILHGLGFPYGNLTEHPDGTIEYRAGKGSFRVTVRDVSGFSVRKATRDDKKRLGASSFQQVLSVQGLGTTLGEVAVNGGVAERIEKWFRAHPDFGANTPAPSHAVAVSVADELTKLARLRDGDVLTAEEFDAAKARLLA